MFSLVDKRTQGSGFKSRLGHSIFFHSLSSFLNNLRVFWVQISTPPRILFYSKYCTIPLCSFNNTFNSWFTSPNPLTLSPDPTPSPIFHPQPPTFFLHSQNRFNSWFTSTRPTPTPTRHDSPLPHHRFLFSIFIISSILCSHPSPSTPLQTDRTHLPHPPPTLFLHFQNSFNSRFTSNHPLIRHPHPRPDRRSGVQIPSCTLIL